MAASNSVLNEYYNQTKGSNLMFDSDDFWAGAWFGSMLNGCGDNTGGDGGGYNFLCCLCCTGLCACLTGNLGTWLCGIKDCTCGSCSLCCNLCTINPGNIDAAESSFDQCCDGLCNICCF